MTKLSAVALGSLFLGGSITIAASSISHQPAHAMLAGSSTLFRLPAEYAFPPSDSATWQLRIYTINRGHLDDFANAWFKGVYPLRLNHGFQIPAAWTVQETNQFVWIIGYEGPDEWEAKEAAYYGSTERASLDPDPRQWIARAEAWFIKPVLSAK